MFGVSNDTSPNECWQSDSCWEEQRCAKSESRFKQGTSPAKGQRSPLTSAVVLECPRAGDGNRFANTVPVSIGESDAIREQEDESLSQIETAAR